MKILSRENHKSGSKNILIPCYLYEIITDGSYSGNNILEEAVAKIIKIEPYYKNNKNKLAEILGLKDSDLDYKDLLELVFNKINNPQTQKVREEIKQYQIYQERISGEVLGIVTCDVDRFIESSGGNKKEIKFEKNGETIKAKKIDKKEITKPRKDDIFKAIIKHNKNGDFKISENVDLIVPENREEIFLHCQVLLGRNSEFSVTNGFNGSISLELHKVLNEKCDEFMRDLRKDNRIDEKKDSEYKKIYNDLRDEVLFNLNRFNGGDTNKAKCIYDAYEQYFAYLVQKNNYTIKHNLNKPECLSEIAKQMGFKVDRVKLFSNDNKNNLKSHLARLLFNKNLILDELAEAESKFLIFLNELHDDRNKASHGGDKPHKKPMDEKELNTLKELLESTSGINAKSDEGNQNTNNHNGIVELEKEFNKDMMNKLSDDNINALVKVYDAVRRCKDREILSLETFSDITQGLYKVCESVLLPYIQTHKIKEKDVEKIRKIPWLSKVKEHNIKNAKEGREASLGAYIIIYLSINKDEELPYLKKLLDLRGHANPTIQDLKKTNIDELIALHKNTIEFIVKVINHT